MSVSNTGGIKTLLEAENKAQEIVQAARTYRTQKLKASKSDAAKEIADYKQKKEDEFKTASAQTTSADAGDEDAAVEASKAEIEALKASAAKGSDSVVKILVDYATGA